MSKPEWDDDKTTLIFRSAHVVSLLVLLNRSWTSDELMRFNKEFNAIISDVCSGHLSFADIIDTINEETGLTIEDLEQGDD